MMHHLVKRLQRKWLPAEERLLPRLPKFSILPVLLSCLDALCRQPLSNISGPPVPQSAAFPQAVHVQPSPQQNAQPHQQQQQHASQQPSQPSQQQQKQQHGAQGQQQHRVRREDENSVVVRGTRYTKLECVGRGGSSKVTSPCITLMLMTWRPCAVVSSCK